MWYHREIGKERCPIVDTWWQTETGSIMISPLPGAIATKPGSATKPFFGVTPEVVTRDGNAVPAGGGLRGGGKVLQASSRGGEAIERWFGLSEL